MDIQRDEAFEKWHFNEYYVKDADKSVLYQKFEGKDEYVSYDVQHSYKSWQAAKASTVEWISVEDKLPASGDAVLLVVNGIIQEVTYFRDYLNADDDWFEPVYFEGDCIPLKEVTHWMPLPDAPQEPTND